MIAEVEAKEWAAHDERAKRARSIRSNCATTVVPKVERKVGTTYSVKGSNEDIFATEALMTGPIASAMSDKWDNDVQDNREDLT